MEIILRKQINEYIMGHSDRVNGYVKEIDKGKLKNEISTDQRLVLSPVIMTQERNNQLENSLNGIMEILYSLPSIYCEDDQNEFMRLIGLSDLERSVLKQFSLHDFYKHFSRPDMIFDGEEFKVCEFNISSSLGGYITNDYFTNIVLKGLLDQQEEQLPPLNYSSVIENIINLFEKTSQVAGEKTVALITIKEQLEEEDTEYIEYVRERFKEYGYKVFICEPGDLQYSNALMLGDQRIDIGFRMFLWDFSELSNNPQYQAILEAIRHNAVFFVSVQSRIYSVKSCLALLSEYGEMPECSKQNQELIYKHIPWTRIIAQKHTRYRQQSVDMISFIKENKDLLIIKPSVSFGGAGTYIGKEQSREQWESIVANTLAEGNYIVQEFIKSVPIELPVMSLLDNTVEIVPSNCVIAPFLIDQKISGYFVRGLPVKNGNVINRGRGALMTGVLLS